MFLMQVDKKILSKSLEIKFQNISELRNINYRDSLLISRAEISRSKVSSCSQAQ